MEFLKISLLVLLNLVLVNSIPISDDKEVLDYLQNFGYLTEDEKTSLIDIGNEHKGIKDDNRLKRAFTNLQKNGKIPITGKYDDNTAALIIQPRCGVSDENLINNPHKRYTLIATKWPTTNITYRFNHMDKERFVKEEDNIRRIIREAFNVWENDTVMKFTESKEGRNVDILISFQHPEHINTHSHRLDHQILGHAFQPGKDLGGDIHLNELINWDFTVSYDRKPEDGKISFYAVLLHLIGHSLGLDHTRDETAVMYGFYSKITSGLSEDDIRGMHFMYGIPPNRKYAPPAKQQNNEEERPIWGTSVWSPDKCHTSYDAIAMIDGEVVAFKGKYMFGPNMDVVEIRSRWQELSPKVTHVDAVHQTTDGKILFFDGQAVYSFVGAERENLYKLSDFGINPSVQKIDAIFRRPDNQRIYIFMGQYYFRFDEHKLMITGNRHLIKKLFTDVYDMDTAFTYKDNSTYFFKDEFYYQFIDNTLTLDRMRQKSSAKFFMNCDVEDPNNEARTVGPETELNDDYIDFGQNQHRFILANASIFEEFTFIPLVVIACIIICLIIFYWKVKRC